MCVGAHHALPTSGHPPEVTKGVALVLLLGALFTVFTLLGKLSPEDVALEAEVVAVEKVAGDWREGVLSTLACWQNKKARTCGSGDKAQGCRESGLALGPAAEALTEGLCAQRSRWPLTAGRLGHWDTTHQLSIETIKVDLYDQNPPKDSYCCSCFGV